MAGMSKMEAIEGLVGIVEAMRADSYDLEVLEVGPEFLSLNIAALEGACAECLAPQAVMAGVISGALGGRYTPQQIRIVYPSHPAEVHGVLTPTEPQRSRPTSE